MLGAINAVKEPIKAVVGLAELAVGGAVLFDDVKVWMGAGHPNINDIDQDDRFRYWAERTQHVALELGTFTSPLALRFITHMFKNTIITRVFVRVFGENTTFRANPMHPKHLIHLVTFGTGLYSLALKISEWYKGEQESEDLWSNSFFESNHLHILMAVNAVFGRTALHIWGAGARMLLGK